MQMTHYERALRKVKRPDEARKWAIAHAGDENPVASLVTELEDKINRAKSQQQLDSLAIFWAQEMIAHTVYLTAEWLKADPVRYGGLTDNPQFGALMAVLSGSHDQHQLNVSGQMTYHLAAHDVTGKRIFDVQAGLAQELRDMELRGLTTDDLCMPFESIYIVVPPEARLRVYNEMTDWHTCEGIYVAEDVEDDGTRCWRFLAVGAPKPFTSPDGVEFDNDAITYWRVPMPAGQSLPEVIEQAHANMVRDTLAHGTEFKGMWDEWVAIFEFAMNTVIYATWPDAERDDVYANPVAAKLWQKIKAKPKGSKARRKAQANLSKQDPRRRTILGKSIVVDRSVEHSSNGGEGTGRPRTHRTRVRGHWRRVAHGPGHSLRRLQIIKPYWTGPADAPVKLTTHKLK